MIDDWNFSINPNDLIICQLVILIKIFVFANELQNYFTQDAKSRVPFFLPNPILFDSETPSKGFVLFDFVGSVRLFLR